jgi:hypothetical protein
VTGALKCLSLVFLMGISPMIKFTSDSLLPTHVIGVVAITDSTMQVYYGVCDARHLLSKIKKKN